MTHRFLKSVENSSATAVRFPGLINNIAHGRIIFVLVGKQQHDQGQLHDQKDQQEDGIAHGHANGLPNGATAAQERNKNDNGANADQSDRHEGLGREAHLAIDLNCPDTLQDQHAIDNTQNANNLRKK